MVYVCEGTERLENKIDEFIHRRFPIDCNWLNGNCYWFAHILCEAFGLKMYYLEIANHFVAKDDNDNYYDWSGKIIPDENPILWEDMADRDSLLAERIVRDCVR